MPRRRPPVEIYTNPVPANMTRAAARCPACGGRGQPYGWVVERLVFKCADCGVRFKSLPAPGRSLANPRYAGARAS